jgi:uncharacterized membrane protein
LIQNLWHPATLDAKGFVSTTGTYQMPTIKLILQVLLAIFMIVADTLHWVIPDPFVKIVPSFLPYPLALVYISGVFEILGGIGLLVPIVSQAAAWGLIALFIAQNFGQF